MNQKLISAIQNQLSKFGFTIEKLTPKESVVKLIESLHPIQTEHDLIRIGPNSDGGYLVPNDLEGIKACFSPGVDNISEFELWCYNHGMDIYLADRSVDAVNIDIPDEKYSFIKKFIGGINNEEFITLDKWVESQIPEDHNSDLLLQMDIEGGEYDSIINTSESLINRFRIIVAELHYLDRFWNSRFFPIAEMTFKKILQTHECVHIHPNNCCGIDERLGIEIPKAAEFTFLRKDRITQRSFGDKFPHELDFDNTTDKHIKLPKIWYKHK